MLSLIEVVVAFLVNHLHVNRKVAAIVTVLAMAALGALAALSNSGLANVKLFGLAFFDLFDYATSNLLLPLGGLFIAIFVGWVWGWPKFKEALTNEGTLKNERLVKAIFNILKFVTPVLVLVVLLAGLNVIKF
jgi:NSS family neurotransmitter:Na+ symporter